MIVLIAACLIAAQPLVATGNDSALWFVGDLPPGFPREQFEIREKKLADQYAVLHSLVRRPIAMAVHQNTLWFVDDATDVALYTFPLRNEAASEFGKSRRVTLQSVLSTSARPTGIVLLDGNPVVVCSGNTTELFQRKDHTWVALPTLARQGAIVAALQGTLIAAVGHADGIEMWRLGAQGWQSRGVIAYAGELTDLLVRDQWALLVTEQEGMITITRLQGDSQVPMSSFPIPKGRWKVVPSQSGLTVIAVERKGTAISMDIRWPSGKSEGGIELKEQSKCSQIVMTLMSFAAPLVLLIVLIPILKRIK